MNGKGPLGSVLCVGEQLVKSALFHPPFCSVSSLCFLASAACQCSQHTCLCSDRGTRYPALVYGDFVSIWIGFWEATKYLILKKQAGIGKQFSLTWMACHETKSIAAVPGNFKGCLQTRQVSELLKKVVKVFVVESVMCLIFKCASQLFPLIENENSCIKIAKYKFYWS